MRKYLPFFVAYLCSVPLLAQVDLTRGLVAHYPFDGNAQDVSGNDNHGTVQGASLTTDRLGNTNAAYQFDGVNDYLEFVSQSNFQPQLPVTISAWIQLYDYESNMVFRNDWTEDLYHGVWLNVPRGGQVACAYGDSGPAGPPFRRSKRGSTQLDLNRWYHVAVVIRDARDMSIYLDGRDDCGTYSGSGGSLTYSSSNQGRAGIADSHSSPNQGIEYFHGKIDDLRFYNRALNEAEILALTGNEPPSTAGLVTGDTSICEGESVVLYGGEANTYQWSPSAGLSCTTCPTPTAAPEVTTTYQVTLNGGTGCARQTSLTVAVEDCQPQACDTIPLQAAMDLSLTSVLAEVSDRSTGAADSVVVLWGDGSQTNLRPGEVATYAYRAEGTYQVCLSAYHRLPDGQSCLDQTCERVEIRENCEDLDLNPAFDLSVEGLMVQVVDRSTGPIDSLRWVWSPDSTNRGTPGESRFHFLPQTGAHQICLETLGSFPSGKVCLQRLCQPVEATARCGLRIPNVFTPNGDGVNDRFGPWQADVDVQRISWQVYDRWGRLLHDSPTVRANWDGTWGGKPMPQGTYFTVVRYLCGQQEVLYRGHLTLLR